MTKPYRPSNGSEGEMFMTDFCFQCARDCEEKPCEILGRVMAYEIEDEQYPKEWVQDEFGDHQRCTAFIPEGEEVPLARCPDTKEMFE